MTLRELLKDYISGEKKLPVKIKSKYLFENEIAEILYIGNELAFIRYQNGIESHLILSMDSGLYFHEEPKKKVKLAPYCHEVSFINWCMSFALYRDDAHFKDANPNAKKFKRCDALEIEVDED